MQVTLNQFIKIAKLSEAQVAGFRRWVRSGKVRRRTVVEWQELLEQFRSRTVR